MFDFLNRIIKELDNGELHISKGKPASQGNEAKLRQPSQAKTSRRTLTQQQHGAPPPYGAKGSPNNTMTSKQSLGLPRNSLATKFGFRVRAIEILHQDDWGKPRKFEACRAARRKQEKSK